MDECHTFVKCVFDLKINLGPIYSHSSDFSSFIFGSKKHFLFSGKAQFRRATLSCNSSYFHCYSYLSFLTCIFVTKILFHGYVWSFLSMKIRFGSLFHVIKHIHTDYHCSICYLLIHLFPCVKDTNQKTLVCMTVGVQAIWCKNSTTVMSEIHKIENKKMHIK